MLVLGGAAENVWSDEQSASSGNTELLGCRNVCPDQVFPIFLIRYWVLQVIFGSSPSLVYMAHALCRLRVLEKERQREEAQLRGELEGAELDMFGGGRRLEQALSQLRQRKPDKAPLRGTWLCADTIHIFTRSVVEVGFTWKGQNFLQGFPLESLFKCQGYPCPNIIDYFVLRSTEKTIFLLFLQSTATVSLFLSILEISHLGFKKIEGSGGNIH